VVTQIRRFSQIVEVLGKYGFGIALARLFPEEPGARFPRRGHAKGPSSEYERVRLAIEELGPTFVKFGQIMSTRTDVLPAGLVAELKKLQDHVKPVPFEEVLPVIAECCPQYRSRFRTIGETPVASASIAQVHRAVLSDGTPVALKIQRPGIEDLIETDISILASMADRVVRAFPETRLYDPAGIVRDFARQIRRELDFLTEARAAEGMRQNFAGVPGIRIPKIYREYSCSRLLVMEFAEGVRIDDRDAIAAMGLDPAAVGRRGFAAYLKMIFEDGFFHGDPHPGNLLVARDGTIIFLDFGIFGVVRPEKRRFFIMLLWALLHEDVDLLLRALRGLGVVIPEQHVEALSDDLFFVIQDLGVGYAIGQFNFPRFVVELSDIMRRYRIRMPANLMLLFKVLVMALDIGIRLDPEFTVEKELSPYIMKISRETLFSAESGRKVAGMFLAAADTLLALPRQINLTLKWLATGTVRIDIVETDIRGFQASLDAAGDKFLAGIVAGSLVVGSSVILRAVPPGALPEVSWIAVLGYAGAALAGFYAVYHVVLLRFRLER